MRVKWLEMLDNDNDSDFNISFSMSYIHTYIIHTKLKCTKSEVLNILTLNKAQLALFTHQQL